MEVDSFVSFGPLGKSIVREPLKVRSNQAW